jgi:glucoamylase
MRPALTCGLLFFQPGVIVPVIPDPEHPEYAVYWLRDGCRVYHTWLNELIMSPPHDDTKLLRTLIDDSVHVLVRTQQVVSLSGNVFTGGLEEPVFDIHLGKIMNPASRLGAPAAGAYHVSHYIPMLIGYCRWAALPRYSLNQICRMAH